MDFSKQQKYMICNHDMVSSRPTGTTPPPRLSPSTGKLDPPSLELLTLITHSCQITLPRQV